MQHNENKSRHWKTGYSVINQNAKLNKCMATKHVTMDEYFTTALNVVHPLEFKTGTIHFIIQGLCSHCYVMWSCFCTDARLNNLLRVILQFVSIKFQIKRENQTRYLSMYKAPFMCEVFFFSAGLSKNRLHQMIA